MFTSNPGPSWQRPVVPIRQQNADAARLKISELSGQLKIAESHYTNDSNPDRQQTATSLVKALRDFAEGWGEFGKYQEQDKDRIKSYTKQKEILETALAINRKGADHEKIAKMLRKWGKSNYSLEGFDKNNLDVEGVDPVEDAKTLHRLGNVHYRLKDLYREEKRSEYLKKAKEYYEKALGINECISHIGDIEVAEMLNNLGSIEHALGNYQKAKEHFEKALPIFEKLNDNIKVATVLDNLGNVYRDSENREEAKKFFTDALSIYKDHGPEHIEVGIISNKLGNIYYSLAGLQKEDEAKELYEKADDCVQILNLIRKTKKELYEKAKNLHQEALPIYEKFYGPNHVEVAEVLDNLGDDYSALKNDRKATESYEKELIIYEKDLAIKEGRYGSNSVEVAEALRNFGNVYRNFNDFQNAEKQYKKELEIRKRHYDSYTTKVVDDYRANMFSKTNVPYIPIEVLEKNYREEKVSREIKIAETLGNLGDVYLDAKDYQKAKELFQKVLDIEEKNPDKFIDSNTLEKLKEITESFIKQLKETLAEQRSNYPSGHLQIGQTLRNLGDAYGELEDFQHQKECLEEALPILKECLGDTNTTGVFKSLANAYSSLGDKQKAKQLREDAEAIKNRNKPNSTLDSTSAQTASHSRSFL